MDNYVIDGTTLVSFEGKDKKIVIPSGIRKIGEDAFKNCNIEEVSFDGKSTRIIGKSAFENCNRLTYLEIPSGVSEIEDKAFWGCENLRYVYIPNSVQYLGKDLFSSNSKTIIVGSNNSKASEYADTNKVVFKDDLMSVKAFFAQRDRDKELLTKKTFSIFGEKIECSSSIKKYEEVKNYYNNLKKEKETKIDECYPKDIDDCQGLFICAKDNLNLFDYTIKRLEKQGIYVKSGDESFEILGSTTLQGAMLTDFGNYRKDIINSGLEDIKQFGNHVYRQAENDATGLGYGLLTSSTAEAVVYEIDNLIQTNKQLKRNYAKADNLTRQFRDQKQDEMNKAVMNAVKQVVPEYKKEVAHCIDAMCSYELEKLNGIGTIDLETNNKIDYDKSDYYLSLANKSGGDICYNIAMALNYNPRSIDAYKTIIDNNLIDQNLYDLYNFVGLGTEIPNMIHKNILRMIENDWSISRIRSEVGKFEQYLPEYIQNQIYRSISERTEKKLIATAKENPEVDMDIRSYCEKELEGIINKDDVQYLHRFVLPSKELGGEWDYEHVINAMTSIRKKEVDKQEALDKIKVSIKTAKTMEEYLQIKSSASSIKGFKDSDRYVKEAEELIKKEEEYIKLTKLAKDETLGEKELTDVIDAFKALGDYKDSTEVQQKCQKILGRIVGERKRKRNKLIITVGSIVIACVAAVFLITNVISPAIKHNKAMKLIEAGDYDAAYAILLELGDENAVENNLNARADELLQKGQYEEAYALYSKAGNEKAIKSSKKERGEKLLKEEKFDEAYKLLEEAGETGLVKQSKKERGLVLLDSGDYDAAYLLLKAAGADDIIHDSLVSRADSLIAEGKYDDAYGLLMKAGETKAVQDSVKARSIAMLLAGNRTDAEALISKYSVRQDNDILQAIIKASKPMEIVSFGKYKQGKEGGSVSSIEWCVLDVQNDRALLVSKKALDAQPFVRTSGGYDSYKKMWADSIIREWLNDEFYNEAFNDEEKDLVLKTSIISKADYYEGSERRSSVTTEDTVFLLSEDEVLKYMPSNQDRIIEPTDYANSQYSSYYRNPKHRHWWLRSEWFEPDGFSSGKYIKIVNEDGELSEENLNHYEFEDQWYVRPAIWVSLG